MRKKPKSAFTSVIETCRAILVIFIPRRVSRFGDSALTSFILHSLLHLPCLTFSFTYLLLPTESPRRETLRRRKFNLGKPIVIADAGLLSMGNLAELTQRNYQYIIGARLKSESKTIKQKILSTSWEEGHVVNIKKDDGTKLVVAFSNNRAAKDQHNRQRGLQRLEKQIKAGRLTKSNINNKGYNKYLKMQGKITIEIDYEKFKADKLWDGLKGYITNTQLGAKQVIENYKNLWHIENAFRMSKTDLRIRPIYHRLRHRIEAHVCISFTAYCIYKETAFIKNLNGYCTKRSQLYQ